MHQAVGIPTCLTRRDAFVSHICCAQPVTSNRTRCDNNIPERSVFSSRTHSDTTVLTKPASSVLSVFSARLRRKNTKAGANDTGPLAEAELVDDALLIAFSRDRRRSETSTAVPEQKAPPDVPAAASPSAAKATNAAPPYEKRVRVRKSEDESGRQRRRDLCRRD